MYTTARSIGLLVAAAALVSTTASAQMHEHPAGAAPSPEATRSFALLKTLAGSWRGAVTGTGEKENPVVTVSLRVASRGNSLVHEMHGADTPDDPAKYDHPVTMMYLDAGRLLLTHYCDAGNRPRMAARTGSDGKTIEFDFVDVAGPTAYGHMYHALFTIVDANHHSEEWTYLEPGGKQMRGHMDLERVTDVAAASGR